MSHQQTNTSPEPRRDGDAFGNYPSSLLNNSRNDEQPSLSRQSSVSTLETTLPGSNGSPRTEATDQQQPKTPTDQVADEPADATRSKESRNKKGNWIFEIVSITLSVGCVAAIAALLAVLDGKALSSWDMPIRPNSLVSIFAAVSKAALIFPVAQSISQLKWLYYREDSRRLIDLQRFDDASRGPWGSLLFLWHFRTRAVIASFGCLITIAALAVDPFTQQIIEYPMRATSMGNGSASISVAHAYDTGLWGTYGRAGSQYIDPGMQAAVLSGLYGLSSEPPFSCPSGNCTWPAITTLGLCSSCQNVTAATLKNTTCSSGTSASIKFTCSQTTPSGLSVNVSQGYTTSPGLSWITTLNATARVENLFQSTDPVGVIPAVLTRIAVARDPFSDGGVDECAVSLCARTYTGFNVTSGTVHTGTLSATNLTYAGWSGDSVSETLGKTSGNTRRRDNTSSSMLRKRQSYGAQYLTFQGGPVLNGTGNNTYTLNSNDVSSAAKLLAAVFTTDLTEGNSQPAGYELGATVDISRALYGAADLGALLANMTGAMTNFVQGVNASRVDGESWREETFVEVHWAWFALPAGLVVVAAALLGVAVVVNVRGEETRLWKSSMLPLLFHSDVERRALLGEEGEDAVGRVGDMEERARAVRVRLGDREGGGGRWRFVMA